MSSLDAAKEESEEDVLGNLTYFGIHTNVFAMRSDLVTVIYVR